MFSSRSPPPTLGSLPPSPFADWSTRASAALLDGLIWLVAALMVVAFGTVAGIAGVGSLGLMALTGGVYYTATMVRRGAHNGQTLGKQADVASASCARTAGR